jgi:outer membrane lipoprotein-sorting protein
MSLTHKNTVKLASILTIITALLFSWSSHAQGVDAEQRGLDIALEADKRNSGFVDSQEQMVMVLRDKRGKERARKMRTKSLERHDDGDWGMTIFDQPADVKGTAMLTYSHGLEPDDQWLYLPALKRVKRISSRNKSGSFMGSEFAFEDMSSFEVKKYTYRFEREEACGELTCFVSEWVPQYDNSGYTRTVIWHDQQEYRAQKIDFYGRANKLLKTLTLMDYQLFNDRFWRPMKLEMQNHKTGKSTLLIFKSYEFGVGLSERDFDQSALKNAK